MQAPPNPCRATLLAAPKDPRTQSCDLPEDTHPPTHHLLQTQASSTSASTPGARLPPVPSSWVCLHTLLLHGLRAFAPACVLCPPTLNTPLKTTAPDQGPDPTPGKPWTLDPRYCRRRRQRRNPHHDPAVTYTSCALHHLVVTFFFSSPAPGPTRPPSSLSRSPLSSRRPLPGPEHRCEAAPSAVLLSCELAR